MFSGPVTITVAVDVFSIFTLSTPFAYNPSLGNLLIEISHNAATSGSRQLLDSYRVTPAGLQRVAQDISSTAVSGVSWGQGELITQFDVSAATATAVPEPTSIAMLGTGALGLIFAASKRRQAKLAA